MTRSSSASSRTSRARICHRSRKPERSPWFWTSSACERAARWAGAKTKQRRQAASLDPALVARAKTAADRITGFSSRITSNRLEIAFADETELAELVEALEQAAST